ncbi:hypothetical protein [Anaerobiospirillum sp. NML120511]|uniref:hypothetical protein n=1 Tax=Anaerobiospirillum sp. NML120511 TaxID=2932819 RepID=UPI001FF1C3B0|nr:hypothetical protein [Anaerobiospirillum sp. NML120511]MCK0534205.1 hypothetical protein [Anaerobiospirillum sp. NML120511]
MAQVWLWFAATCIAGRSNLSLKEPSMAKKARAKNHSCPGFSLLEFSAPVKVLSVDVPWWGDVYPASGRIPWKIR